MQQILLAGANGLLGSYIALELLKRPQNTLLCLVRRRPTAQATSAETELLARLQRSLQDSAFSQSESQSFLEACRPRLKVVDEEEALARGSVQEIWQVGWSPGASPAPDDEPGASLEGTARLLEGLGPLAAGAFNHVSTAYVAGDAGGEISEGPYDPTLPVRRACEQDARTAERAVAEACTARGVRFQIYRPTVIVGDTRTKRADSQAGLYRLLMLVQRIKDAVDARVPGYFSRHPLRLRAAHDASLNLIAVDRAAALITSIAESSASRSYFHIASARSIPLARLMELVGRVYGIRVQTVLRESDLNAVDADLGRNAGPLGCHLGPHRTFAIARAVAAAGVDPEQMVIDDDDCLQMIEAFARERRQKQQRRRAAAAAVTSRLQRRELPVAGGEPLTYLTGGTGHDPVLIVNAYGQSAELWSELVERWLPERKVVLLQPRGIAGEPGDGGVPLFDEQVADLHCVVNAERLGPCRMVAWCTGPKVALRYALEHPTEVSSLALVTGAFRGFRGTDHWMTDYERSMEPLCRAAIAHPERAGFIVEAVRLLIAGDQKREGVNQIPASQVLTLIDQSLRPLLTEPFRRPESFIKYARQLLDFWALDLSQDLPRLAMPTLFIGAENDRIASPQMSCAVARGIAGASFVNVRGGSHYCMHDDAELIGDVIETFWTDPRNLGAFAGQVAFSA